MIVLASASSTRAALLRAAGVTFEVVSSGVDEGAVKTRMLRSDAIANEIAGELALAKALAVSASRSDLVIGADQTLELDGELFDKVETLDDARERLRQLRGRTHTLHSAVALARNGETLWQAVTSPKLTMRAFSDTWLETYLATAGEAALNSVGCYNLEGPGAQLFAVIEGDYFSVLGLPLIELLAALRREAVLDL
ncbi:MAG TPA: nucleoside triphosphate pyrophosphatase [Caulobacteraceae bacterium]